MRAAAETERATQKLQEYLAAGDPVAELTLKFQRQAAEIERIAKGEGVIRPIGKGEIAATVSVRHKSGVTHVQSLDKRTHKALERIVKRGRVPDPRAFDDAITAQRPEGDAGHHDRQEDQQRCALRGEAGQHVAMLPAMPEYLMTI